MPSPLSLRGITAARSALHVHGWLRRVSPMDRVVESIPERRQ